MLLFMRHFYWHILFLKLFFEKQQNLKIRKEDRGHQNEDTLRIESQLDDGVCNALLFFYTIADHVGIYIDEIRAVC